MPKRMVYDRWLFFTTGLLVLSGLFMVGSSSNYEAMRSGPNPSVYLWKHALFSLLGFSALILTASIRYQVLAQRRVILGLFAAVTLSLLFVLAMPATAGAHRWIPFGPVNVQPSEFAKLFCVVFMAYVLARKEDRVNDLWVVPLPSLLIVGGLAFLIVIEPDLGSAVMPILVGGVMLFAAGLRWLYLATAMGIGMLAFAGAVLAEPYRWARITSFMNPDADPYNSGYQLIQSLVALGNGGLTGVGLGSGQQKAYYLPEAHTDFIFSVLGEEFGLIGASLILVAFLVLFWRGLRTALRAPDRFGFYLALGVTSLIVFQALINICVCVGLLPTKGLPLPFISYGGSSLLASMTAMGLLLNVSQHSN